MLHVNWHHFLLTTKLLYRDTDAKYRPVFQGDKMLVIIFFWMALFVSVANLETTWEKKKIMNHTQNYRMEQLKSSLKFYKHTNHL